MVLVKKPTPRVVGICAIGSSKPNAFIMVTTGASIAASATGAIVFTTLPAGQEVFPDGEPSCANTGRINLNAAPPHIRSFIQVAALRTACFADLVSGLYVLSSARAPSSTRSRPVAGRISVNR